MEELQQYLIADINGEKIGFNVANVEEIVRGLDITKVTTRQLFVEGLVNLRNKAIPVINLKKKLFDSEAYDQNILIVTSVDKSQEKVALMVDNVIEVLIIPPEMIDSPETFTGGDNSYIKGIGKLSMGLVVIADIPKLLADFDAKEIKQPKKTTTVKDTKPAKKAKTPSVITKPKKKK